MPVIKRRKSILWFKDISSKDVVLVGGKNASLGEMFNKLKAQSEKLKINVPNGFATTSMVYWDFLKQNKILNPLKEIFRDLDVKNIRELQEAGRKARELIINSEFPDILKKEITKAYKKLSEEYGQENTDVAVRSSATAEDLPSASFAGQHETYLNVRGEDDLLKAIKKCIASLFNDRAISYREEKGFKHFKVALSVGVMKMVRSDLASAGVIFTLDTESGFRDVVLINGSWGLGEMVVKGKVVPDEFLVFKQTLGQGFSPIISKTLGTKRRKLTYSPSGETRQEAIEEKDRNRFILSDEEILLLAKWAIVIEKHYGLPMDIEWAKDGKTGELFIVQARPETVHTSKINQSYTQYVLKQNGFLLLEGEAIGSKIASGKVKIISDVSKINDFKPGEVLVTKMTDPDWTSIMKEAKAIITEEGGRTCFGAETKILTSKGYLSIADIVENRKFKDLKVLSLNRESLQFEWKKIIKGMKRESATIDINISQTGRMENNILKVTPDHKFLTFRDRKLISPKISDIIENKEYILSAQQIPSYLNESDNLNPTLAYFLGGISTDGHVHITEHHGEVQFIQKNTSEKKNFIKRMGECMNVLFNYSFHHTVEKISQGIIRGKVITGGADRFRCYSKEIAYYINKRQNQLPEDLLVAPPESLYNFLAGTIDGDGTYNNGSNRINIFCSKQRLSEGIIIACLRLGISFQVVKNRTINNIQIVDKVNEIFKYTARVKGKYGRFKFGTRFFSARQLINDIIEKVNYKGRIAPYIKKNLLIDIEKIRNFIIPLIEGQPENHRLTEIINSQLRMLRVGSNKRLKTSDVYNIEVEDNHNYIVFTSRYTPVVVENCHAAIVSRELGIPCIVGADKATQVLKNGQAVTVDCSSGQTGRILRGELAFEITKTDLKKIPQVKTKIMVNVGTPATAFANSFLPNDGVGLAREEFIIASKIRAHPLALIKRGRSRYFVDELARGIGQIGAAFWPKPVIVRFSDFKTNEYAALEGGAEFEPKEQNPMLGWRGASRYYDPKFKKAFLLECQAMKKAREVFGLKNIWAMIPFCRTVEEGKEVLGIMKKAGLAKGKDGLKVIVMCEIPSNVILADKFLDIFDGMSIGSNDLTQLILGIDRDNAQIAYIGDERNEAVKEMVGQVIKACRQKKKYCGICGQAPSDFPDFAEFLAKEGIESISLNPDTVIKTILSLSKKKKK